MKKYQGTCPKCGATTVSLKKGKVKCMTCGRKEGVKVIE